MQITIQQMVGHTFQVEVEQEDTVESLKMKIYNIVSIKPEQQRLIYQGQLMEEFETISYYEIQEGSVIILSVDSTGGGHWRGQHWGSGSGLHRILLDHISF